MMDLLKEQKNLVYAHFILSILVLFFIIGSLLARQGLLEESTDENTANHHSLMLRLESDAIALNESLSKWTNSDASITIPAQYRSFVVEINNLRELIKSAKDLAPTTKESIQLVDEFLISTEKYKEDKVVGPDDSLFLQYRLNALMNPLKSLMLYTTLQHIDENIAKKLEAKTRRDKAVIWSNISILTGIILMISWVQIGRLNYQRKMTRLEMTNGKLRAAKIELETFQHKQMDLLMRAMTAIGHQLKEVSLNPNALYKAQDLLNDISTLANKDLKTPPEVAVKIDVLPIVRSWAADAVGEITIDVAEETVIFGGPIAFRNVLAGIDRITRIDLRKNGQANEGMRKIGINIKKDLLGEKILTIECEVPDLLSGIHLSNLDRFFSLNQQCNEPLPGVLLEATIASAKMLNGESRLTQRNGNNYLNLEFPLEAQMSFLDSLNFQDSYAYSMAPRVFVSMPPAMLMKVEVFLTSKGFEVECGKNVDFNNLKSDEYAGAIIDYLGESEEVNGIHVAKTLRAAGFLAPIWIAVAMSNESDEAEKDGFLTIRKPLKSAYLTSVIEICVAYFDDAQTAQSSKLIEA